MNQTGFDQSQIHDPLGNLIQQAQNLSDLQNQVKKLDQNAKDGEKVLIEKRVAQQKLKD